MINLPGETEWFHRGGFVFWEEDNVWVDIVKSVNKKKRE